MQGTSTNRVFYGPLAQIHPTCYSYHKDIVAGFIKSGFSDEMSARDYLQNFFTNLDQPMPLGEKLTRLVINLWRRVIPAQTCCGHPGEPAAERQNHRPVRAAIAWIPPRLHDPPPGGMKHYV
jgi:hypothetical protein